ncbi:Excinuclease ABC subunit C [Slackia heliotrinireducens]|uniref:UvrABC system protein C n=1 Tax=Slackia heliotrinireducens (strain ATCC 29202 / DSM 20476 / NCTC 11029 / RHS 1) TaxID=471855 RepID=C7N5B1_SLAHD|nr:excinuclease ABC subunit UvrC [Slackia heliotrinireducens]ACV22096.1 excinuclease ABC, C subunit [Slackia heliotrinireducens DSM 20476]VEH00094.1 Excinuclease ABC subunit C [Slackia heliotrinireducens]
MANESRIQDIKHQLASVPTLPGVYLWKNKDGEVIYVGKAKQLRARMRQYVNFQDDRAKIPLLVDQIDSFEYIVVENEHEALVLEKNLINQYAPFFNADFKDNKSYPFIALTKGDVFPAIKYTREKHVASTRYFGPYTDGRAARQLVDIVRKVVPLCSSSCAEWRRLKKKLDNDDLTAFLSETGTRPCFDAHVGLGPGACCGQITPEDYRRHVERVEKFLSGRRTEFIEELTQEMMEAAADLDFERAARLKSRIDTINSLTDRQHAVSSRNLNADVVGIHREETIAGVHVFMIREGRIINSNEFVLDRGSDVPDEDLLHTFLLRYYDATTSIPHEVIVERELEDSDAMEEWLTGKLASKFGAKVHLTVPARGEKAELLEMARKNASHTLNRYKVRTNYEDKRVNAALLQLESALALDEPPMRIECFDISTIHGSYTVASMVVFTDGRPDKGQYRRFKIKTPLDEADDFLSMREVIGRRYAPERMADTRFGKKPDLLILDGGLPQLNAVLDQFEEMGINDIPVCGLAKRDEELFVPWQQTGPVVLPGGSASLYLVKHVRDESHRFAITFHRELRGKGMTKSILDDVVGLGPVRKKALLKSMGGFKKLRAASLEEIKATKSVPAEVAEEVYAVLRQYNEKRTTDISEGLGEDPVLQGESDGSGTDDVLE